jgi:hypothetical protein
MRMVHVGGARHPLAQPGSESSEMQTAVNAPPPGKQLQRKLLRALNGAAIGAFVGGLLGYGLGAASAFVVDMIGATFFASPPTWSPQWSLCATMGLLPAVPAGFLLGTSIVLPDDLRRLLTGGMLGLVVGGAYAGLWAGAFYGQPLVLAAIVGSGLVGGLTLSALLTAIRRHWKWWTRWEEVPAGQVGV